MPSRAAATADASSTADFAGLSAARGEATPPPQPPPPQRNPVAVAALSRVRELDERALSLFPRGSRSLARHQHDLKSKPDWVSLRASHKDRGWGEVPAWLDDAGGPEEAEGRADTPSVSAESLITETASASAASAAGDGAVFVAGTNTLAPATPTVPPVLFNIPKLPGSGVGGHHYFLPRHRVLANLNNMRKARLAELRSFVALGGQDESTKAAHQADVERALTKYLGMVATTPVPTTGTTGRTIATALAEDDGAAARSVPPSEDLLPLWEFSVLVNAMLHSSLFHLAPQIYHLLRQHQTWTLKAHGLVLPDTPEAAAAAEAASSASASSLSDKASPASNIADESFSLRLAGLPTTMLLQCFAQMPQGGGVDTAVSLLREFERPSMRPLFHLIDASYAIVLQGLVNRGPTDSELQQGGAAGLARGEAHLAEVRAFWETVPHAMRSYKLYAVLMPVLLRYGKTDELEQLRSLMTASPSSDGLQPPSSSLDGSVAGAGVSASVRPSALNANAMGLYIKSLSLELQHVLDTSYSTSASHSMRLLERAEQAWARAKRERVVNPIITVALIKVHKLVNGLPRIKAILKDGMLLERAHHAEASPTLVPSASAGGPPDGPAVALPPIAPVYVDPMCFGALFHSCSRATVPLEHVEGASKAFALMMRRHSDAVTAAEDAYAAARAAGPGAVALHRHATALSVRASALRVDGAVMKMYLRFLRSSGQGDKLLSLWRSMNRAQKLHTPFAFVALLNHLTKMGDRAGVEREAALHDEEQLPWDVPAFTAHISACKYNHLERGAAEDAGVQRAEAIWARMLTQGFTPDSSAYAALMQALLVGGGAVGRVGRVEQLYGEMRASGQKFRAPDFLHVIKSAHLAGLGAEVVKWGERAAQAGYADALDDNAKQIVANTLREHVRSSHRIFGGAAGAAAATAKTRNKE